MKKRITSYIHYFIRTVLPSALLGAVSGVVVGGVITFYRYVADRVIHLSAYGYDLLRQRLWLLPVAVGILWGMAWLYAVTYRRHPRLQGSGIPTSINAVRGVFSLRWFGNMVGTFVLSLLGFLVGVPLGTEGPSVQMGTALGLGVAQPFAKQHPATSRHVMTGGACAGFAAATGAPISGFLFAVEEAHRRITLPIVVAAMTAVTATHGSTLLCSSLLGISPSLFSPLSFPALSLPQLWMPLVVGLTVGLLGVLFLQAYRWIKGLFDHVPLSTMWKIFIVLAATVLAGVVSPSFRSTGHHLIEELLVRQPAISGLVVILAVRILLTLSATSNGVTGGLFLPTLAVGAIAAAIIAKLCNLCGMEESYNTLFVCLGITASVAGMMKMPLTAVLFSAEALSLIGNLPAVLIVTVVSYLVVRICKAQSIADSVVEAQAEPRRQHNEKTAVTQA